MNKYYTLSDDSDIYRIAMGEYRVWLFVLCSAVLTLKLVLHPSLKLDYFREARWPDTWIEGATEVTRNAWESRYKPTQAATRDVSSVSPFFLTCDAFLMGDCL